MSALNSRPTVYLQPQSRLACTLSSPGALAFATRPWRTSLPTQPLGLEAQKQRLHSFATALCVPLRKQQEAHVNEDTISAGNLFVEIIKSILRDLRDGVLFIVKQPKELQYLEFPSLQSAGKMAIFTVAVVMVLIVFLATVDSGLSFIVASVFRRIR